MTTALKDPVSTPDPVTFRRPPGRYGPPRGQRSRWVTAAVVALALFFTGAVLALAWQASNPPVTFQVRAYDVLSDEQVELTFLVRRDDPNSSVTCVVRARDARSREVGRSSTSVASGQSDTVTTVTLTTAARANLAEVESCRITPTD